MNRLKQRGFKLLALLAAAGMLTGCGSSKTPDLAAALAKTAEYEQKTVTSADAGSLGGE